jgi:multidrug efflux pump subunit AcrB
MTAAYARRAIHAIPPCHGAPRAAAHRRGARGVTAQLFAMTANNTTGTYVQPRVVLLFTIPVSLIGITVALMAAGQGLSVIALMGVLMVIGIAVSNGILLVDEASRRFQAGEDATEAVIEAARIRFIPIAMTSLATVVGLVPTALGLERGTEANQPLALAVVGGLSSSTVLSLFLVPAMFTLLARRSRGA